MESWFSLHGGSQGATIVSSKLRDSKESFEEAIVAFCIMLTLMLEAAKRFQGFLEEYPFRTVFPVVNVPLGDALGVVILVTVLIWAFWPKREPVVTKPANGPPIVV